MCKSRSFRSPEGQDSEVLGDHSHCVLLVKAVTGLASQRGEIDLGRVMNNLQILFFFFCMGLNMPNMSLRPYCMEAF